MALGRKTIAYRILVTYEKAFEKFGLFLARKSWVVLLLSVLSVFACGLGFIRLTIKHPSSNDFTVTDSQSRVDFHHAAQFFPLLEARQEQIVMTPKHRGDILGEDCLKDVLLVHQTLVKISGFEKLCFKQPTRKKNMENQATEHCAITSPLELAGVNFDHLSNLSSILAQEWTNSTMVLSTGQSFRSSFEQMLSGFKVQNETRPLTARADALRIIYFLRKETSEEDQEILDFEMSFESAALSVQRHLQCASLSFKTGKASDDALKSILQPETRALYLSALTMTLVALIVIYLSSTNLNGFTTVSLILLSLLLPLVCAAGFVSMVSTSIGPTTLFIPFLLMGKITSDVVVFLQEWEHQKVVPSLEHRVSGCVATAGIPLTLTAICGAAILAMAIRSPFAVISQFFLAAFVTYVIVSIASFTTTEMLLFYFEKRGIKPKMSLPQSFLRGSSFYNLGGMREFCKRVLWMPQSVGGKVSSFFMVACIITASVFSILQPGERMGTTSSLYHKNDNFNQFSEAQKKFFGSETDVSIVFSERANYSKPVVQDRLVNICQSLQNTPFSQRGSDCWMADLLKWAKHQNMSCSNLKFHQCLNPFLDHSTSAHFRQDLRYKDHHPPYQILASRIHVKMSLQQGFKEDRRSVEKLRDALPEQSPLKAVPVSETFFDLDDLFSLERETFFILLTSTVVVFVLSLLSSASLWISTCITGSFMLLVLEAAGLMKAWGAHLNHITFIALFLTVVMAFDFSLRVLYLWAFSVKPNEEQGPFSVGWSVITSALLEASGTISLGFIFPSLQDIFFRLIPPIFALGLLHGLMILPSIVTVFFKIKESLNIEDELDVADMEGSILLDIPHGKEPQGTPKHPGICIVGTSCRFPGANSKDLFWKLLEQGNSSIRAFPQNRADLNEAFFWLYNPQRFVIGRHSAIRGSYMEEITHFDNRFFGISNLEARKMDPQQRILLEVVYEAIEDAGMRLEDLQKCKTGVFVGVMNLEFGAMIREESNSKNIDQFSATGVASSIIANRLSFCFNLTGPSISVDTACSSSLTALKIACDSLHNEDCDIAIVCAPNIILDHGMQIASSMAGLLAPDGRSKSFDASGDGYGRGEGFAAVILKLSHAALSDKDDIYCEILACGMNNDGQNAIPMTAPSSKTQAELCKRVLEQSGVTAEDIDYFEAHGTGTAIGDVVEVTSIAESYTKGATNPTRKLRIGSVKSNLNHTESTSGLAGLIKVALMIKKQRFVPTVNVNVINPKLKLEERGMVLQQTCEPWTPDNGQLRTGAVNSFGFGGSNVHVIVREVGSSTQVLEEDKAQQVSHVLTLSAHSQNALKRMAGNYSKWLKENIQDMDASHVEDLCYSLNQRRSQFPHRLSVSFTSISEASKSLGDYADDSMGWEKDVCCGEVTSADPNLVFMFGGQGSQWYAMGRQLIACEPVFKEAILTITNLVQDLGGTWSLIDELMASEETSRISENSIAQPATFAVQYATAQLLKSWKIHPSAVIGHSLGEFAAACVAGIVTLKEAVELVLVRSTLQDYCPGNGGMAALGMSEEEARTLLLHLKLTPTLDIAAVNDAKSVTVSGDSKSVEALGQHLATHSKDTFWRVLGTKRAFHSSHMEVIKKPFQAAMKKVSLKPQLSKIPMYSTVKGEVISGEQLTLSYWWQNIRCPVQFQPAMKSLLKDGYTQIIEISTQPILAHYVKQIATQENLQDQAMPLVLPTLPRKRVPISEQHKSFLLTTVCKLYSFGFPIDWACVQRNPSAKFIRSLTYPWLENRFWYREHLPQKIISPLDDEKSAKVKHPFLEKVKMTDLYSGLCCWETEIDLHRFPNLKDHALQQGGAVMPGAGYLEMALAMVKDQFAVVAGLELSDVRFLSLLTLPDTQVRLLRLRLLRTGSINKAHFNITSVLDDQSELKLASGNVCVDVSTQGGNFVKQVSSEVGPTINERLKNMTKASVEQFEEITETFGFKYGPTFSIIKEIWKGVNEGICLVDVSDLPTIVEEAGRYLVHPSILDACLQSCFILLEKKSDGKSFVPVSLKSITLNDVPSTNQLYCHAIEQVPESRRYDITLMSPSGKVLLRMNDFRGAELTSSSRQLPFSELAYEVQWIQEELNEQSKNTSHLTCIVLKDSSSFSNKLVMKLEAAGCNIIPISPPKAGCPGTMAEETIQSLFAKIPPSSSSNLRVINLWPTETSLLPANVEGIEQAQHFAFMSSIALLKLLIEKELNGARLFLITAHTQLLKVCTKSPKDRSIPWGSTAWGLRRTADVEGGDLKVTAVDLCNKEDQREVDLLVTEVLSDSFGEEVAFRDGKRFVNRFVRSGGRRVESATTINRNEKEKEKKRAVYLSRVPSSETLCLREQSFSVPSHSGIAIDVFSFWTPSDSLSSLTKPNTCIFVSGKVADLPQMRNHTLHIGDEVCGFISSGRVGSSVTMEVSNVFSKPVCLTREQATHIPACLSLASYALQRASSGEENQTFLIHEANRSPGPAAVLLANMLGHRVFCTISNTCKISAKELLLEMGAECVVQHPWCSLKHYRDTDQFDAIIFFSPPSPNAFQDSGRSLRKGGRVIILSSEFDGDIVVPANWNVKYERENISDLLRRPHLYEQLSLQSLELLKGKGVLKQLLRMELECVELATSIKDANESVENASSQKHEVEQYSDISNRIQLLTTLKDDDHLEGIPLLPVGLDECGLKENRTYLVAGGMGGLGFEVVRWMAENGAKTIGILSRSKPSEDRRQEIRQIERRTGAKLHTFQVDISSQDQILNFKDQLQSLPSVAGIVQSAMVLRDEYIVDLTFDNFNVVMGPKVKGSFFLHQLSLEMDLDFFVMFSSTTSLFGNMKASSYCACCAFQDSLAEYRRHVLGLPALTINWGAMSGAGVLERDLAVAKWLETSGFGFVDAKDGIKHMAKVLNEEPSRCQIALVSVDWSLLLKTNSKARNSARLSGIRATVDTTDRQASSTASLAQRIILEKDQEKRRELISEYVGLAATEWTGVSSPSETDLNKSLYSYGVDSTWSLSLKMQLENNLGVSFEVYYFMQPDTTLAKLTKDIEAKLRLKQADSQSSTTVQTGVSDSQEAESDQTKASSPDGTPENQIQVVPLHNPKGAVIKFFCVHPSHRYALSLMPISSGFQGQDSVSFYALGFTDPTALSEDWGGVRELALHYVKLITKEQRHGPYFLGGYSYGGIVAYEIASLLTEQKQRVEFVAMIDTFPWFPRSRPVSSRMASQEANDNIQRRHVERQFEDYLRKLAVDALKMATDEYQILREEHNQDWIIAELQRRSLEKGLHGYNLEALKKSLLKDTAISGRTYLEWQPPKVRYQGPLTYLKCENQRFTSQFRPHKSIEEVWSQLVDGGATVLVCPGDHYSMSDFPHAHVTGSILATALVFSYRVLFPEFPRPARTFSQRRAVEKLCKGVIVFLHSKKGKKRPHFGKLHFEEGACNLELQTKPDEGETNKGNAKTKKIIHLTDLRMVQPGRFVSSALKFAGCKRRVGVHRSGNLGQVASVITGRRVYNLEFADCADLKAFYNMIEAVFGVTLLSS